MKIKMYQVDAFSDQVFGGNPAAICLLNDWLPDHVMQAIATENNLPETAFIIENDKSFLLRWFTPSIEVDLCGHATLASAYVVFQYLKPHWEEVIFESNSGPLIVKKCGAEMQMDFPALSISPIKPPEMLIEALAIKPQEVYTSVDYLIIVETIDELKAVNPDFNLLKKLDLRAVIVSAIGDNNKIDFGSRFFAPKLDIPEDPITGSAHCALVPYWAKRLKKTSFNAQQMTSRNIKLRCELANERVLLFGKAVSYLEGEIRIN